MVQLFAVLTLLRLLAFMALVYVGLGWLVERRSRPGSRLRAFFHVVCAPITGLVARRLAPGTSPERLFRISFLAVALVWTGLVALHGWLRPAG